MIRYDYKAAYWQKIHLSDPYMTVLWCVHWSPAVFQQHPATVWFSVGPHRTCNEPKNYDVSLFIYLMEKMSPVAGCVAAL